ncbi:hypothetical protein GGI43DRAFT_403468 [Trichoderma evansii]
MSEGACLGGLRGKATLVQRRLYSALVRIPALFILSTLAVPIHLCSARGISHPMGEVEASLASVVSLPETHRYL